MITRPALIAAFVFSALLASSPVAWAATSPKDIAEARKLVQEGQKAEKDKDWDAARKSYLAAIERNDTADARLKLAALEEQIGHLVEALEQFRIAAEHKKAAFAQKKKANDAIKRIEPRIPSLSITVPAGFSGTVRVDEMDVPSSSLSSAIQLNPGTRVVTVHADGFQAFEKSVVLAESAKETLVVELLPVVKEAPPPAASVDSNTASGRKTWGYIGLAAGGVGVVVGSAFGLAARGTREDLRGACVDDVCSESQRENFDRGKTQANISTAGFIVGGLGLGIGSYLLLTASGEPEKKTTARVTPYVGPGSVGVEGSF